MAKNRTETKSEINLVFQPVLEIADHRTYLNAQADDVKFRKDVIQTQTAVAGAESIDFTGKDTYVFTASGFGGDVALTLNNMDNGDEKYLIVNKNANQNITFSNATNLVEYPSRQAALTLLLFRIIQKNGVNYVELLSNTVGTRSWTTTNIYGEASSGSRYRVDEFGYLEIRVDFRNDTGARALGQALFTLPAGFRPINWNYTMDTTIFALGTGLYYPGTVTVFFSDGTVVLTMYDLPGSPNVPSGLINNADIAFYLRIPLSIS